MINIVNSTVSGCADASVLCYTVNRRSIIKYYTLKVRNSEQFVWPFWFYVCMTWDSVYSWLNAAYTCCLRRRWFSHSPVCVVSAYNVGLLARRIHFNVGLGLALLTGCGGCSPPECNFALAKFGSHIQNRIKLCVSLKVNCCANVCTV